MEGEGQQHPSAGHVVRSGRAVGLPGRVRDLLTASWTHQQAEPRARFGLACLPGLACLDPSARQVARGLLERAAEVRAGRFTLLGCTCEFGERVDWAPRDLSTNWHAALHRLDDLNALGVAAAMAEPSERIGWYAAAMGLIEQWRAAIASGHEVAFRFDVLAARVSNLLQAHSFFARELRTDAPARRALLETVYAQSATLAALVPDQPSSPALIAAGRALFLAGRLFDGLEARGWLDAGVGLLWGQLREQFQEDGGHRDRVPTVHAALLAEYLHVFAVLDASNEDIPVWGRKRVKGMTDFLLRLLHPDGTLVGFHGLEHDGVPPVADLVAAAAVLLDEPSLARGARSPGVWPVLWMGDAAFRVLSLGDPFSPPAETRALRRTRYYVLAGDDGDVMFLDGEVPGIGGRANTLGYELSIGGERLVVTGSAPDEAGDAWIDYARGPRAHNVLTLTGARAETGVGEVTNVHWTLRHGLVCFSGVRTDLVPGTTGLAHRRRIVCLPGRFWIVCDEVLGSALASAESYIHFHPGVSMTAVCRGRPGFLATRGDRSWAQIVFASGATVGLQAGVETPAPQGWVMSPTVGLEPAPTLVVGAAGRLPVAVAYAILPRVRDAASLELSYDQLALRVELTVGGDRFDIALLDDGVEFHRPAA